MDPQTPRELGDIEDAEARRPDPARTPPVKKTLVQFLADFEKSLEEHPGDPATSAQAALEGRAQGVWRTPVESGTRATGRQPRRHQPLAPVAAEPLPLPPPRPDDVAAGVEDAPAAVADQAPGAPAAPAEAEGLEPVVAPGEAREAAAGHKRQRRHRHRRRR